MVLELKSEQRLGVLAREEPVGKGERGEQVKGLGREGGGTSEDLKDGQRGGGWGSWEEKERLDRWARGQTTRPWQGTHN